MTDIEPVVAALYVEGRGVYVDRPDVDAWPLVRDATLYAGPHPIVAHPPCGPWGRLRRFSRHQDAALAPHAVRQLARWGGVLEHPETSLLWRALRLPLPGGLPRVVYGRRMWARLVEQVRWGHPCRKRTWLLFAGVDPRSCPAAPPAAMPSRYIGGDRRSRATMEARGMSHATKREALATPPAFADWLISCAQTAAGAR